MRKLVNLIAAISLAVAMLASQSVVANAATVVGRINGGGMAIMEDGKGLTSFAIQATLFSDGTARGRFDCVDHMGAAPGYPGNVFGEIKRWTQNKTTGAVTLYIEDGKVVSIPGGLVARGLAFTVTIQHFGGAGVGHWTLDIPGFPSPSGGPICVELLTSGQIVARWN